MKTIDYTLRDALLLAGASACTSDYVGTLISCLNKAKAACEMLDLIELKDVAHVGQTHTMYSLQHNARALHTLLSTAVDAAEYMHGEIYTINRELDRVDQIAEERRKELIREEQREKDRKERNKKYYRSKKARKAEQEQQEAKAE